MKPIELLEKAVCEVRGIDPLELHVKTRKRYVCETRQMVMYFALLHRFTHAESSDFFKLDHSTANHSRKVINNLIETDRTIKIQVDRVWKVLQEQESKQMIYLSQIDKIAS
jgi:chromosomal replication initiation ATPase DnaA